MPFSFENNSTSSIILAISNPLAPAFPYIAPPIVPGRPVKNSAPAMLCFKQKAIRFSIFTPDEHFILLSNNSISEEAFTINIPLKPLSENNILVPPPTTKNGILFLKT